VRQRSTGPGSTSIQGFVPIGLGALPPASQHDGGASAKRAAPQRKIKTKKYN